MLRLTRARCAALVVVLTALPCGCKKDAPEAQGADAATARAGEGGPKVVAEPLPRCRADARALVLSGDDVVAGDAVIAPNALLLGVIRREGAKRVASIVRAPLDLSSSVVTDVGPAFGDDPPPVPRLRGNEVFVVSIVRKKDAGDAGIQNATRELRVTRLDGRLEGAVTQQADESTASDVAWPLDAAGTGPALVAWDEDAPIAVGQFLADRGTIKVQLLGQADKKTIVPYATDAEQPRLLARPGGWALAWLARKSEGEDAGYAAEGPAETRAFRWVELAMLDAKGDPEGPIRRVTPDKGRVASFELARGDGTDVVVVAHDEAASREGAGARIVRHVVSRSGVESTELAPSGVGHALPEVVPTSSDAGAVHWLSWTDNAERAHLVPLDGQLAAQAPATTERALDRARIVAATRDALFAVASEGGEGGGRVVVRRLSCR
jgi:hypothetical protein